MERTLLLVDDEENILSSLSRLFRRDHYRILKANSGKHALEVLASNEVSVIVSDQRMPEMTGAELFSQVKDLYPNTVRIILSGYTELNSITDAINKGAIYKFLTKPWDDELLRKNVREAFDHFELRAENERLTRELEVAISELSSNNKSLEQSVVEKAREAEFNYQVVQTSHDILENLPVAVIGIDNGGIIVIANRYAREIVTLPNDSLIGSTISEIFDTDLAGHLMEEPSDGVKDVTSGDVKLSSAGSFKVRRASLGDRGVIVTLFPAET